MKKETKRLKFWNRMARKALFKYNSKRGDKYYKIYEFCMQRRTKI